ncbi:MAG: cold-shock protein [Desulfobacterales bacterium]
MARSQDTFNKKEREKKRQKKRKEKAEKKLLRKAESGEGKSFEDMLMYVDENGNLTPTPPDPNKKKKIRKEDIEIGIPKKENIKQPTTRSGVVKFFNDEKGYGFIVDQDTKESIFVHANGLIDEIRDNDKVSFEVEMGAKGPNAVAVKVL